MGTRPRKRLETLPEDGACPPGRIADAGKERGKNPEALLRAAEEWRKMFDSISEAISVADSNYRVCRVNRAFAKSVGLEPAQIIGKTCHETILKSPHPCEDCPRRAGTAGPRRSRREICSPDLNSCVEFSTFPILNERREVVRVVHISKDITEQRKALEELEESQRVLFTLMSNLQGMAYRCRHEKERPMEFVSEGCFSLTGYHSSHLMGSRRMAYAQAIHPEDRERVQRDIETALTQSRPFRSVYRIVTAGGEVKWVLEQGRAVTARGGTFPYLEGFITDISDRKITEERLQESVEHLRRMMTETVTAMARTVETRDPYTAGHQRRVAQLSREMAREMGFPQAQVDGLVMAASIHDIGKISVPTEILSKPGRLTSIEFDIIKTHPGTGHNILKMISFPWPVADIVLQHHERMDGSGYPAGMPGGHILREARIIAVADVVESLSSHRPYRPAFGIDRALEEISKERGILYDPDAVDACLTLFREKKFELEPL